MLHTKIKLDADASVPLYRQLADTLAGLIQNGLVGEGERLPATRELASQLGLNRATISAAYALLEETGLLEGHVGRGSFVAKGRKNAVNFGNDAQPGPDWSTLFAQRSSDVPVSTSPVQINFASSRPDQVAFPLPTFRKLAREVVDSGEAGEILQLGSPYGYAPLRRFLLEEATTEGVARTNDGVLMTNGCQQALDLLARVVASGAAEAGGSPAGVVVEDPAYHGMLRIFSRTRLPIHPVPVGEDGLNLDALEETLVRFRPRVLIVTPSFHNPTGTTMPLASRRRLLELVHKHGLALVENDIYSQLRYVGNSLPSLKELDTTGNTILLRSYSKVAFPGLRVGWVIAPRAVITRMADEKQVADLHSDQLSQAILLRFAESGELGRHLERTREVGRERLRVALAACERYLPAGSHWTRPEGGMSLWITVPAPLSADQVLARAQKLGIDFLPGKNFARKPAHERSLRISFGGLAPASIDTGLRAVGEAAVAELEAISERMHAEPAMALV